MPLSLAAGRLLARLPVRGRGRLAYRLHKRYAGPPDQVATLTTRGGHVVQLPVGSSQTWLVAYTGGFGEEEVASMAEFVEPDSVVLDIGACFGLHTLPLAEIARSRGSHVVAVEPVPANLDLLRNNVASNGLEDFVTVVPYALGEAPGQAEMQIERGGAGNAALGRPRSLRLLGPEPVSVPSVPVRRLDDLALPALADRRCSLIKIDVEGYEMSVLHGAEQLCRRHRPVVFGEFGSEWFAARGVAADAPRAWAHDHDYEMLIATSRREQAWSDRRRIELVAEADSDPVAGLVMIPAERQLSR